MYCVWNSQLVGDSFNESEQICQHIELCRVGGVNAAVGSRRELVAKNYCVHTVDATHLDSCDALASAVCIGRKRHCQHTVMLGLEGRQ